MNVPRLKDVAEFVNQLIEPIAWEDKESGRSMEFVLEGVECEYESDGRKVELTLRTTGATSQVEKVAIIDRLETSLHHQSKYAVTDFWTLRMGKYHIYFTLRDSFWVVISRMLKRAFRLFR